MDVNLDFDEQLEKLGKVPPSARYGAVAGLLAAVAAAIRDAKNSACAFGIRNTDMALAVVGRS